MNSRREFLPASSVAALGAYASQAAQLSQKAKIDAVPQAAAEYDYWNDLPNYMIANMEAARQAQI